MRRQAILAAAALGLIPAAAWAAPVSYSTAGGAYTQDFNTLASTGTNNAWSDGSTLAGWHTLVGGLIGGATTDADLVVPTTYVAANGTSSSQVGKLISLGADGDSDRALGTQSGAFSTSNAVQVIALLLTNDTGETLNFFDLSYTGLRRRGQSAILDGYDFDFQVFAAGAEDLKSATGWTDVNELDFSPTGTTVSVTTPLAASNVAGLNWQPGETLVLRWSDRATGTTTFMMGVDDVSFSASAVPEPATASLIGLAGTLLLGGRRRR